MKKIRGYLDESNLIIRQGQQLWHLHQALKMHDEAEYIGQLAKDYKSTGRVQTIAEGVVLAGAVITGYRSNEAGERAPQHAREKLDAKVAEQNEVETKLKRKGA